MVVGYLLALLAVLRNVIAWDLCGTVATTSASTVLGSMEYTQRTFCLPPSARGEPAIVQGMTSLVLQNVVLPASTVLTMSTNSTGNDTARLSHLLALPGVVQLMASTAQLVLTNVTVECSCGWLYQLQALLCSQLSVEQLLPLE
ncbi:hypothetical protein HaLaN_09685, partial [Haematococcus lacustris]